jgi:hypothetical protein
MRTRRLLAILSTSLLAFPLWLAGIAGAQGATGGPISFESMQLRTERGVATFQVDSPDALESTASRVNTDLAGKDGVVPANTPGYLLTNRIVVRAEDATPMMALRRARPTLTVESLEAAPGFWIVHGASVREANRLAGELAADTRLREVYLDMQHPRADRALPTDPQFPNQWHLRNTQLTVADINVEPAWNAGYTGNSSITVGILEGGWRIQHPDLAGNYNATASQSGSQTTTHGTSCAGLVGAVANNGNCGVGVAYNCKISKQYYGTSSQTATAIGFRNDLNFIKSNSWGPADNGLITYLSSVERAALDTAVSTGRGGKGTIFAWAAGNGGTADRCDYDPYASNRKTFAIGAIGDQDTRSSFNETGSSMLVVTPSSGNVRSIYTTTGTNQCTSGFGGTSAACPIGAGCLALILQANSNLTWRDAQHVLINAARKCDAGNALWTVNGAGHDINYNYGFGAVDVFSAIQLATGWTNVAAESSLTTGVVAVNTQIPDNNTTGVTRQVTAPAFNVESIELVLNVAMTYVGDLQVLVTAPSGTQSLLAAIRADATDNYTNYVFTSLRHWDEDAAGTWTIKIHDGAAQDVATWTNYTFNLYGTP